MSSDGDDRRTFFGFEIFHSGIFWARKILIYVGFFCVFKTFCIMLLMKQKMFFGVSNVVSEKALAAIRHRFFFGGGGLNFVQGLLGFVKNCIFFLFLSTFDHPRNLKSGVPPPPYNWVPQKELLDSK